MDVWIDDAVFAEEHPATLLPAIFHLCRPENPGSTLPARHRIRLIRGDRAMMIQAGFNGIEAPVGTAFAHWCCAAGALTRAALTALHTSQAQPLRSPTSLFIVPRGANTAASRERLRVTAEDAFTVMSAPLCLLLEHAVNDLQFLLNVPATERQRLRFALKKGWLRVEHGGGVGTIPELIAAMPAVQRARLVVITDRDGASPHQQLQPSSPLIGKPLEIRQACEGNTPPSHHHAWHRRAIENYVPIDALERFPVMKGIGGGGRTNFLKCCKALRQMNTADANGWRPRYGKHIKHHLARTDIADIFNPATRSGHITDAEWERWMIHEGSAGELSAVVQEILRRL